MNNNDKYIVKVKKEKTFFSYIFETILAGFLLFIIFDIIIGLISFMLVLNEKEPIFYIKLSTYSFEKNNKENNVKVYYNFLYKIVILETNTSKTMNIKLWFSDDIKGE